MRADRRRRSRPRGPSPPTTTTGSKSRNRLSPAGRKSANTLSPRARSSARGSTARAAAGAEGSQASIGVGLWITIGERAVSGRSTCGSQLAKSKLSSCGSAPGRCPAASGHDGSPLKGQRERSTDAPSDRSAGHRQVSHEHAQFEDVAKIHHVFIFKVQRERRRERIGVERILQGPAEP